MQSLRFVPMQSGAIETTRPRHEWRGRWGNLRTMYERHDSHDSPVAVMVHIMNFRASQFMSERLPCCNLAVKNDGPIVTDSGNRRERLNQAPYMPEHLMRQFGRRHQQCDCAHTVRCAPRMSDR